MPWEFVTMTTDGKPNANQQRRLAEKWRKQQLDAMRTLGVDPNDYPALRAGAKGGGKGQSEKGKAKGKGKGDTRKGNGKGRGDSEPAPKTFTDSWAKDAPFPVGTEWVCTNCRWANKSLTHPTCARNGCTMANPFATLANVAADDTTAAAKAEALAEEKRQAKEDARQNTLAGWGATNRGKTFLANLQQWNPDTQEAEVEEPMDQDDGAPKPIPPTRQQALATQKELQAKLDKVKKDNLGPKYLALAQAEYDELVIPQESSKSIEETHSEALAAKLALKKAIAAKTVHLQKIIQERQQKTDAATQALMEAKQDLETATACCAKDMATCQDAINKAEAAMKAQAATTTAPNPQPPEAAMIQMPLFAIPAAPLVDIQELEKVLVGVNSTTADALRCMHATHLQMIAAKEAETTRRQQPTQEATEAARQAEAAQAAATAAQLHERKMEAEANAIAAETAAALAQQQRNKEANKIAADTAAALAQRAAASSSTVGAPEQHGREEGPDALVEPDPKKAKSDADHAAEAAHLNLLEQQGSR